MKIMKVRSESNCKSVLHLITNIMSNVFRNCNKRTIPHQKSVITPVSISFQTWYLQTVILIKVPHYLTLHTADDRWILATLHQHQCFTLMARASSTAFMLLFSPWQHNKYCILIKYCVNTLNWLKDDHPLFTFILVTHVWRVTSEAAPNSSLLA